MDHLMRHLAPITAATWKNLDDEARDRLAPVLGARRLVDFGGPLGWEHSAMSTGRVSAAEDGPLAGTSLRRRVVLPLVEARVPFSLSRAELDDDARGALDTDLGPLDEAAVRLAELENRALLSGDSGFAGIIGSTPHPVLSQGGDPALLPRQVAQAVELLSRSGVGGPYALAAGSTTWIEVLGGNDAGGQPLRRHVERALDGPIVWTPGVDGAVVVSTRGGDFRLEVGQDISLGYAGHTADTVELYLEESFAFQVATPEAAVVIR
ncbi:family 1 encapsulin nanocompartment shell protein [Nocardioides kongjuensis]|uniref:Type 1 encapsulin shell protein n=1 Tax=Nocardioides kongjuensis TaxID=349522 RepID=A0A852RC59_9ACTN|nr:family 1 encapsulin nanocompartment shell protein [Nocardioides kongjuensis]NYD28865.1 putative linocin/CFP29 family protein [Nocardioides kongjuensis]